MKKNEARFSLVSYVSRKNREQFIALIVLMFFASIAEVISIGAVVPFLGVLVAPEDMQFFKLFAELVNLSGIDPSMLIEFCTALFILTIVFASTLQLILLLRITKLSHSIGKDLSKEVFLRLISQPYWFYFKKNSANLILIASQKVTMTVNQLIFPSIIMISSILVGVAVVSTLLIFNPVATCFVLVSMAFVYGLLIVKTKKMILTNGRIANQQNNKIMQILQESLGGIRDIILDNNQKIYVDEFVYHQEVLRKSEAILRTIGDGPRFVIEAFATIVLAIAGYYVIKKTGNTTEAISSIAVIAIGAQKLLPICQKLYISGTLIHGCKDVYEDLKSVLTLPIPIHRDNVKVAANLFLDGDIRFSNVIYGYGKDVLLGVDLLVKKGSFTAIVGKSGSGKSTLIDILMGLLDPDQGCIYIGDSKLDQDNKQIWQRGIAHVPQNIFLIDASIAENVALAHKGESIDMQRVREVCKIAQIDEYVQSLEFGYQTLVGEKGVNLSGGQRQRFAIARALYKDFNILILDEATSALDNETEKTVMREIIQNKGSRTIVVVTHNDSLLEECDYIYELADGKLVQKRG